MAVARSAWGSANDSLLAPAISHVLAQRHLFAGPDGGVHAELDEEAIAATLRALRRSQVQADFASELCEARSEEEKHTARRRFARPLEAWSELRRRIASFNMLGEDGSPSSGPAEAATTLAGHWAPVFDAGDDNSDTVADTFLADWVARC